MDSVEGTPKALIADLGTASVTANMDSSRPPTAQLVCTPRWAAPEVLDLESPSQKSDVYSFALLMIEVRRG